MDTLRPAGPEEWSLDGGLRQGTLAYGMSRPTTIRLDDEEFRELERLAIRQGTTVSGLIKEALRARYFRGDRVTGAETLLRYIEEHPGVVEDTLEELEARIDEVLGDAAGR
jgi:hypothetical protein